MMDNLEEIFTGTGMSTRASTLPAPIPTFVNGVVNSTISVKNLDKVENNNNPPEASALNSSTSSTSKYYYRSDITRMLVSKDGTQIYANAVGDPSKQAIVFIHGFAWSFMAFDWIFGDEEWLKELYLVRYDVRGHGRSGNPDTDEGWESKRFSEDFDTVVEEFKLDKPFVAGWSLGASHLMDILSFHPITYLSGIINICGAPYLNSNIVGELASPPMVDNLQILTTTSIVEEYQEAAAKFIDSCCTPLPYDYRQLCLGKIMSQSRLAMKRSFSRSQRRETFDEVGNSDIRCLVISGDEDDAVLTKLLPDYYKGWRNVKVEFVKGGNHVPWFGHGDEFREKFLRWVNSV